MAVLLGAGVCHLMPMLGGAGRRVAAVMCRAPALDLVIGYFTVLPWVVGAIVCGWVGLVGGIVGQVVGMLLWQVIHEWVHRDAVRGERIVKTLNRKVGAWRNHSALWLMTLAVPGFSLIRIVQWIVYPGLVWLVRLPPYKQGEWVNVSRQKFSGLVGHDLIWCLYCDWMTGLWALGSEMLRNLESFWCPIRFYSDKKCDNCAMDFPDVNNGWVAASGTMGEVTGLLDRMYPDSSQGEHRWNPWYGHPVRVTVRGEEVEPQMNADAGG